MKKRLLFVTERWCDGTPNLGLTNNFHNLFNTFSQCKGDEYNWNCIHLDEADIVYNTHIDNILPQYCLKWDINIIVFSLLGQSPVNPSKDCYEKLKNLGIKLIFMWPDTGMGWGIQTIKELGNIPDLNISWDNPWSVYHNSLKYEDNHLFLWVPQDNTMFYNDEEKSIPISFIGSDRYQDRFVYLRHFKEQFPQYAQYIRGGQREEMLSPESYAKLIRHSEIGINFALSPAQFFQTKGRIFEILACGSMLLEFKNPSTAKLFVPEKEYIEFTTPQDLVEKVKYYTEHTEEAYGIAQAGYHAYQRKYTAQHFWDTIFNRIKKDTND